MLKKTLSIILAGILLLTLTACSNSQDKEDPVDNKEAVSVTGDVISDKQTEKEDDEGITVTNTQETTSTPTESPDTTSATTVTTTVTETKPPKNADEKPTVSKKETVQTTESKPQKTEPTTEEKPKETKPTVETEPEYVKPPVPSTSEVERMVAQKINEFRDILIGKNYTLQEVNTPIRYVIPDNQTVDVLWNKANSASFENILKKWRADVFKIDADIYFGDDDDYDEDEMKPMSIMPMSLASDEVVDEIGWPYGETQGDATLEGAVYGVYCNGELIDTYTTDENGWFITNYYPCGDNNEWTIQEITPSTGYQLDPWPYYVDCYPGNYTVERNTEYLDVYEDIIESKIAIIKHADDGSTQIETPEVNAEFEVYLKSVGSYENARDRERALLVTDKDGFAETQNLPYGVYIVKQIKGLEGKELMPAFEVNITENHETYRYLINNATFEAEIEIVKKDAETGKVIPAAGIGFKVRNTDTGEFVVQHIVNRVFRSSMVGAVSQTATSLSSDTI